MFYHNLVWFISGIRINLNQPLSDFFYKGLAVLSRWPLYFASIMVFKLLSYG